jgi:hypothetical protein
METPAARARRGSADFDASFDALREAVSSACSAEKRWEAAIAAGIGGALRFAAAEPAQAHALMVHGRRRGAGGRTAERRVIEHFAGVLHDARPADRHPPIATDLGVVEAIATVVRGHLQAGAAARLPQTAPDMVYLALVPCLGVESARAWAISVDGGTDTGTSKSQ